MKITCLGDSLTYGNVGYSYIHFLNPGLEPVNLGKNGDTIKGAFKRLKKVLRDPEKDSDTYVLGIGTNDTLLPYLRTVSWFWKSFMGVRCRIKECIEDDDTFYKEYGKLLELLSKENKRVIVLGSPLVNMPDFPYKKLLRRNEIIKELAEKYSYPFVDTRRLQTEQIEKESTVYSWERSFWLRVTDAIAMIMFPSRKDAFAKKRKLTTSVDGVHFNAASAKVLAAEIERILLERMPPKGE